MDQRLILQAGAIRAEIAPGLGGAVASLARGGLHLLRPAPPNAADVLEMASFPLVPYANRIADGRIAFGGKAALLRRNGPGQVHPLHGDGWRCAWAVEAAGEVSATLTLTPIASDWPWPYAARQVFRLTEEGLHMELSVTNTGGDPAPAGLGFHPYFPGAGQARMTARTAGVWLIGDDLLPVRWVEGSPFADWGAGAPVATGRLIDHCHTGWDGRARIELPRGTPPLKLTASQDLSYLHVYVPPADDFFCLEPVSHRPNAFNAADPAGEGIRILAPGETWTVWMQLQLVI